jgi:hypothetical protein
VRRLLWLILPIAAAALLFPLLSREQGVPKGGYNSDTLGFNFDGSNDLYVNCNVGCGASGFSDNSAFTVGTTAVNVIAGLYDSGAAPTISNGNAGRVRIDSNSYLLTDCATGCSGGATTPGDAFATPTTASLSASFLMGYNGASWDMLRTGDKNNVAAITGVLNNAPVGRYNATQPTLTDGRWDMLQLGQKGSLEVTNGAEGFAVTGTFWQATQPVSGTFWQATQPVSGTFWQATQPISGTVTAQCSTACEVSPTTAANTVSNQFFDQLTDGSHGVTINSTTYSSKYGLDENLLGTLGTAFSTAGFIDIKGADGNVFVRQTTAANLNATVVGTGTFATQSAITAASGAIASGAVASGAFASGSIASGAVASGAIASGAIASGACASGCIADGGETTLGAEANAKSAATDTTAVTIMQVLKEISSLEQAPASRAVTNAGTFAVTQSTASSLNAAVVGVGTAGSASGGVLTIQGVASMTKLLVTPDSVALPANQSVNTAQLNGHTLAECGLNGCQTVGGAAADGSAATTDPVQISGKGQAGVQRVPVVCDAVAPFSLASTTALKIITLTSGKNTYICSINLVSAAANNVALIDGTKVTNDCDTATHGMAGGTSAAAGWNFAANGGLTQGSGIGILAATVTVSHDVCLLASGSGQVSGVVSYTQF